MRDQIQRFLFEESNIRGEIVTLDDSWREILSNHDYPDALRNLLGEMLAATTLLIETLKFDGKITMQITGEGPVNIIVAEATSDHSIRGVARWKGVVPMYDIQKQIGEGQIVISVEPRSGERYQGIVPIVGLTIAEALEHYLKQSEQLPTRLVLGANGERCAGLLIQRLPEQEEDDDWDRVQYLTNTMKREELLEVNSETVIRRLFHEDDLRMFEKQDIRFECGCSRERVANTLRGLGQDEVDDLVKQEGDIQVKCEYCNNLYVFDAVDAAALFTSTPQPTVTTKPQ